MRNVLILLNTDFTDITDFDVCYCQEMYRRIRFLDHQASSHKLPLKQGRKAADPGPRNITPASPSFVQIASF